MTSALHLSPLVAAGLVRGPIDIYESTKIIAKKKKCKNGKQRGNNENETDRNRDGKNESNNNNEEGGMQSHPGSGAAGRDIGVGIWSTAWWPFLKSVKEGLRSSSSTSSDLASAVARQKNRQSYRTLLQDLEACGSYVGDVGYRTPDGSWLVKSELNAAPFGIMDLLKDDDANDNDGDDDGDNDGTAISDGGDDDPALLFVREKDLLSCLRNAIKIEQRLGTVKYHSGVKVDGIENVKGDLGSLVLRPTTTDDDDDDDDNGSGNGNDDAPHSSLSPRYHLVIAADGLYSTSRSRFAGHHSIHAAGTGIESSQRRVKAKETLEYQWEHTKGQREATQVEDREYIVFRGEC